MTEGKKTEPNYFFKLRDRLQLSAAVADVIIVHPEGTDPVTLTQEAIKLREERKRGISQFFIIRDLIKTTNYTKYTKSVNHLSLDKNS